jgi:hypothetical protein
MVETETRETCFGADVQELRQGKWPVTHMATYIKYGNNQEETVARVKAVAECVMTYLSESVGEWDDLHYPFEEAFRKQVNPSLLTLLEKDGFLKISDIGTDIGTTKSLDELCMGNFICDTVPAITSRSQHICPMMTRSNIRSPRQRKSHAHIFVSFILSPGCPIL